MTSAKEMPIGWMLSVLGSSKVCLFLPILSLKDQKQFKNTEKREIELGLISKKTLLCIRSEPIPWFTFHCSSWKKIQS